MNILWLRLDREKLFTSGTALMIEFDCTCLKANDDGFISFFIVIWVKIEIIKDSMEILIKKMMIWVLKINNYNIKVNIIMGKFNND